METLVPNAVDERLLKSKEEMSATTAARTTAGPTVLAGGSVYIITARKMNASATERCV